VRPRPPTFIETVEWLFCFIALAMMTSALIGPLFAPEELAEPPEILRLIWLPVYAGLAGLAVLRAPKLASVWLPALAAGALVALAFYSAKWSIAPDVTERRSIALLFTTLFGLLLAARYSWRSLIELYAAVSIVLALGSYFTALVFPEIGVHSTIHPGAWRGLWYEKNQFGAMMAWGALACACAVLAAPERRKLWLLGVGLCAGLVVLCTGKTSLIGLTLALGGVTAITLIQRGGAVAVATCWGAFVVAMAAGLLLALSPDLVLEALGKDPTLTGRTGIWESLLRRVEERPWTGYGYAAFWTPDLGPAWYVRNEVEWEAPSAHNGWLEVLIQLGWPGLFLISAHIAAAVTAALLRLRRPEGPWAIMAMTLFILFSLSESTLLQQNNVSWAIYVAITAKLFQRQPRAVTVPDGGERAVLQAERALAFVDSDWRRPAAAALRRTSA
jgi:exopolysaccharide production protein ExoQ